MTYALTRRFAAPTATPETSVRSGQTWGYCDGDGKERRFIITKLSPNDLGTTRVHGSHVGSGRTIGTGWTVRRLVQGYRQARLVEDAPDVVAYTPPLDPKPIVPLAKPKFRFRISGFPPSEKRRLREKAKAGWSRELLAETFSLRLEIVDAIVKGEI